MLVLNELGNGRILSPIYDIPSEWEDLGNGKYQSKHLPSLLKKVGKNGVVTYKDSDRVLCTDVCSDGNTYYSSSKAHDIIDEMFPIEMPYMPPQRPYKVYTKNFINPTKDGQREHYGTMAILFVIDQDDKVWDINRYFKVSVEGFTEICKDEYLERLNDYLKDKGE